MGGNITGLVIDQTRSTGKWYVREAKDQGGGVRPLFFRRDKSDLIGRLADKFGRAESAQRYVARHMDELGLFAPLRMGDVYAAPGVLKPAQEERTKLNGDRLQRLLEAAAASASPPSVDPLKNEAESNRVPPTVTVIRNTASPELLNQLWHGCQRPQFSDKQDKRQRKDFEKLMGQAMLLQRGELSTNDPAIWKECREFVNYLNRGGADAWSDKKAFAAFTDIRNFFLPPASRVTAETDATVIAIEAGKTGFALERIVESSRFNIPADHRGLHQSNLQHAFQIYLEEISSADAMETVVLPWRRLQTADDPAALSGLLGFTQGIRASDPGDQDLIGKAVQALRSRLARVSEGGKNKTPGP